MKDISTRLSNLVRSVNKNDCWLCAPHTPDGYGRITIEGKYKAAHRIAYEQWVGPIPDCMIVHHRCHQRNCINPNHLEIGDHRANTLEMHERQSLLRRIAELEAQLT